VRDGEGLGPASVHLTSVVATIEVRDTSLTGATPETCRVPDDRQHDVTTTEIHAHHLSVAACAWKQL
jgi:hypothetical protein